MYTLVSGNAFKISQWKKIIPTIEITKLDITEIQGNSKQIVVDKCLKAWEALKTPVVVEDVSLSIENFDNFPGPYIKWFMNDLNKFAGQKALFIHWIAYFDGKSMKLFHEEEKVNLVENTPLNGFENMVTPEWTNKTFDTLDWEIYKDVSPRIRNIKNFINQ